MSNSNISNNHNSHSNATILNTILTNIKKDLRREISDLEVSYVKDQVKGFVKSVNNDYSMASHRFPLFMKTLIDQIRKKKINQIIPNNHAVDIHELLKTEIQEEEYTPINVKHRQINQVNINTIFNTADKYKLLKKFNPSALKRSTYIVLDRRYHLRTGENLHTFTWSIAPAGVTYNGINTAIASAPLKNIVGIKVKEFRFPSAATAVTFSNRLTLSFQELNTQAYTVSENNYKFQFMLQLIQGTSSADPYTISDVGEGITEFDFNAPVQELTSLTLSFGNPFQRITLNPDRLQAIIASSGVQTTLTFTVPHNNIVGDIVLIEGFLTDNTAADYVEIELMNDVDGWPVTAKTSTQITIDVDLSSLTGSIINNPYYIYFDSKRFIIPLEFVCLQDSDDSI